MQVQIENFLKPLMQEWQQSFQGADFFNYSAMFQDFFDGLQKHPEVFLRAQTQYMQDFQLLSMAYATAMFSQSPLTNVIEEEQDDKRFKNQDWKNNPWFSFIKQSYLLYCRMVISLIEGIPSLDAKRAKQILFFSKQWLNVICPTNFPFSNPDIIQQSIHTSGQNFTAGWQNFMSDVAAGKGAWSIKMTDLNAFELGRNIAATKGSVVYQNELIQLIQYAPLTDEVYEKPLLIFSPWINKYYNLDLQPENSLVRYAVSQGHTVFIVSWLNPEAQMGHLSFEDYVNLGGFKAVDAVLETTGCKLLNVVGYCIGGTMLSCLLSIMAKQNDQRIASASYFTSLIDFSDPGDLGVFIDEYFLKQIETRIEAEGIVDGRMLAMTFNMLRANDLIWSFYVNNYLKGTEPVPFDLLYWNSDSTNLPGEMHKFYLRNMYQKNLLKEPDALEMNKTKINIRNIKIPIYSIATERNHIAPWKSVYKGAQIHGGDVTFVLGGSGHIAGVVNPPAQNKYGFRTGKIHENADVWYQESALHPGSWWTHWSEWLQQYAGPKVKARDPKKGKLKIIEPAPGSYVRKQLF